MNKYKELLTLIYQEPWVHKELESDDYDSGVRYAYNRVIELIDNLSK
jgi:hypothetical protein